MKELKRDDLWNLRYKYYALYKSLIEKLPYGTVTGSYDYLKRLHRMDVEAGVYAKVIQDIDKLLGV